LQGRITAVANIGVGEFEPRLLVVLLLRHHAVEPDGAAVGMGDGGIPDAQSVAAAAQVRAHHVEAEE
jgi:hypothetical protein